MLFFENARSGPPPCFWGLALVKGGDGYGFYGSSLEWGFFFFFNDFIRRNISTVFYVFLPLPPCQKISPKTAKGVRLRKKFKNFKNQKKKLQNIFI